MRVDPSAATLPRDVPAPNRAWLISSGIVAALTLLFCLHLPSAEALRGIWVDTGNITYTHGFVIAALSAWMILRHRRRLAALPWKPSPWAALLALPLGLAWLVAVRAGIELIHELLLVAILWLAIGAVAGRRFMRDLTVPVAFLIFALPVWDQINGVLQAITVVASTFLLGLTGIPAFVDGNTVHLAVGSFEIEGGCSGLHFFIVGLTLAVLYGELGNDRLRERVLFVALAGVLAMISNWLRVTIIVIAGHVTNMQAHIVRVEHYWFGWGMFAVTMVVFFFIARRIAPPARAETIPLPVETPGGAQRVALAFAGAVCVCIAPLVERLRPLELAPLPATLLPQAGGGWTRAGETVSWAPTLVGVDRIEVATFVDALGARVQALAGAYADQHQDKELVSYGNALVSRADGVVVSSAGAGSGRELVVTNDGMKSVVRYVYVIGAHRTARDIAAQLWYGVDALRGATLSHIFALRAHCGHDDCADARRLLDEFAATRGTPLSGEPQ
jgi:exosortase A